MELHLATNQELIDELIERTNFVGAVIYSMDEHRSPDQEHNNFGLKTRCGDKESTRMLLELMASELETFD